MVARKHKTRNSNSNSIDQLEGSLTSLGGNSDLGWPSSSADNSTPRGGEKKKKVKKSIFSNSFSNLGMLKAMEHTSNDGWMKVQAKKKKKKKNVGPDGGPRKPLRRTFSGVSEEDLHSSSSRLSRGGAGTGADAGGAATNQPQPRQSTVQEEEPAAPVHTAAFYSDDEIMELVQRLATADNWMDALDAICAIRLVLKDEQQAKKEDAAKKLFKFQVVPALVLKLQKYGEHSDQMTEFAARILVQLTYFEPKSKQVITLMGGVPAVYEAAQHYQGDMYVSGNVTVLLSNLALDEQTRDQVNLEQYIDYVLQHMKDFPDESYTQRVCCKYLANIGVDSEQVNVLLEKSAMPLVALAFQNHREDEGVRNVAKEALQMFLDQYNDDDDDEEDTDHMDD